MYVSYRSFENSSREVKYTIFNTGVKHEFLVNQRIGGGTWVYLGTFPFRRGEDAVPGNCSVTVSLKGQRGEVISVDGIRFGGGMGNVARRPAAAVIPNVKSVSDAQEQPREIATDPDFFTFKTSGKSRYREGARYYLQYAGFPDTLVYSLNEGKNDYNDDYQSRGEWVNYLMGRPNGPQKNRNVPGMEIPVDLAFSFHTDAGITPGDSVIGTLGIYSTWADKGKFPDGSSRMVSRDLTDLIQTQIVEDIRTLFDPAWTRRGLWDRQYSEAWRPNVPAMLLELLSHQNLADQKFGLDPRFQFAVGRAIYKGMLRFLAFQEGRQPVVHPLPVDHFALAFLGDTAARLTWRPVDDPLEPTVKPCRYKVYRQVNGHGFDGGTLVDDTSLVLRIDDRLPYDFRVTALNAGGESFPSETLSLGLVPHSNGTVLVVSAFDRVSAPAVFDAGGKAGIEWWRDQGVPRISDTGFVGTQYDFDRKSAWTDDDNPGWGSSYGDMEDKVIPGNSFDFAGIHGSAINGSGYSFISVSDEVFCRESFDVTGYAAVSILLGEEKSTPSLKDPSIVDFQIYTLPFMNKIREITAVGGNILISGAYVGSEASANRDTMVSTFAREILHFAWRTSHAAKTGSFYATDYGKQWFSGNRTFNTGYSPDIYTVEAPDGIEPSGKNAFTAFRYGENNVSAGVAYKGMYSCVVLGFPLETVTPFVSMKDMTDQILNFFKPE